MKVIVKFWGLLHLSSLVSYFRFILVLFPIETIASHNINVHGIAFFVCKMKMYFLYVKQKHRLFIYVKQKHRLFIYVKTKT